ncbi:MAG TPA: hypothetical protein RMI62_24835, partial [Polyangiaceae bacterium LLY-WYZ-15_(1-7)]|nr:hypothetical protein [Polyangiaceae bacterium LLY-WYZ-15_(1-7)]
MRAVRHIAEPPRVPAAPLIGGLAGALAYRRDPPAFLRRWRARLGPVFTLSLAGVEMTVVAGPAEAEPVLRAPDTRLGARAAQARFGFERTLGPIALHVGTDLHQTLLVRERRRWDGDLEARLRDAVARALDAEPSGEVELFAALRRVALRATARAFGSDALAAEPFLARFAAFQDVLEEATARGAALPGFVARPLVYEPVHRRGRALVREV